MCQAGPHVASVEHAWSTRASQGINTVGSRCCQRASICFGIYIKLVFDICKTLMNWIKIWGGVIIQFDVRSRRASPIRKCQMRDAGYMRWVRIAFSKVADASTGLPSCRRQRHTLLETDVQNKWSRKLFAFSKFRDCNKTYIVRRVSTGFCRLGLWHMRIRVHVVQWGGELCANAVWRRDQ